MNPGTTTLNNTTRRLVISLSGATNANLVFDAAPASQVPSQIDYGYVQTTVDRYMWIDPRATALTIVPVKGNVGFIKMKGSPTDVGIPLDQTRFSTIALPASPSNIYLRATSGLPSIQIIVS